MNLTNQQNSKQNNKATNQLNQTRWSSLSEANSLSANEEITCILETWGLITMFTTSHCFSLSSARLMKSTPSHMISWWSILILPSHLCLGLPNGLFTSSFPTKTLNALLLTPIYSTCLQQHNVCIKFCGNLSAGSQHWETQGQHSDLKNLLPSLRKGKNTKRKLTSTARGLHHWIL